MNKDFRIIYLSKTTFPSKSANSIHLMKMSQALAKIFTHVELVGFKSRNDYLDQEEIFKKYNVKKNFALRLICIPKRGINVYFLLYVFLFLIFKSRKKYLIYGRDLYLVYLANLLGFKVILESHDFFYSKSRRFIEKKLLYSKNLLKLVVISESLKKDYAECFHNLEKIEVHHDAADIIEITNEKSISWPSHRDTLQIGYFGHLYKGRGIEIIIEVAKELRNFDFHIIGGNDSDIEKYKGLSLSDNLYFHGFRDQRELPLLRNKCDILLMPYQEEIGVFNFDKSTAKWMSPMKLFEYMSSKKAIISSDLPVLRELLDTGNSILVRPDCVPDWIDAIKSLSEKDLRDKLSTNAYQDFLNKYTWDIRAENIFSNI